MYHFLSVVCCGVVSNGLVVCVVVWCGVIQHHNGNSSGGLIKSGGTYLTSNYTEQYLINSCNLF